jgi:hypothetical protein
MGKFHAKDTDIVEGIGNERYGMSLESDYNQNG